MLKNWRIGELGYYKNLILPVNVGLNWTIVKSYLCTQSIVAKLVHGAKDFNQYPLYIHW